MRVHSSIQLIASLCLVLSACGGGGGGSSSDSSSSTSSSSSSSSSSSATTTTSITTGTTTANGCASGTYAENVVCAVAAFQATLTSTQLSALEYSSSTYSTAQLNVYKTRWSNLPGALLSANRAGLAYGDLTTSAQISAFLNVADAALTDAGYADFLNVLAADDYLGTIQSSYGSSYAHIAVIGTPATSGQWMLMIGNHHMAFNITFKDGVAYPTPHHIGVEPKAAFTLNGSSYQALVDKASSMVGVFYGDTNSLGSTQLSSARLSATYGDILIGAVEYNTGSYSTVSSKFPTGSSGRGVLVSSLSSAQQAMVTAAITKWASDYDATRAAELIAEYTSATAYASTYVAWSGSSSVTYPNVDVSNTYMRIDGPRVWIEIACQGGVVIQGQTHYHMIFRDKSTDYYNELSTST